MECTRDGEGRGRHAHFLGFDPFVRLFFFLLRILETYYDKTPTAASGTLFFTFSSFYDAKAGSLMMPATRLCVFLFFGVEKTFFLFVFSIFFCVFFLRFFLHFLYFLSFFFFPVYRVRCFLCALLLPPTLRFLRTLRS